MDYPNKRDFIADELKDYDSFVGTQQQLFDEKERRIRIAVDKYLKAMKEYMTHKRKIEDEKINKIKKDYGFNDSRANDIIHKAVEAIDDHEDKEEIFQIITQAIRDILMLDNHHLIKNVAE